MIANYGTNMAFRAQIASPIDLIVIYPDEFHRRSNHTMPTPMVAAARPALRSADPGCSATVTIIRFMASGKRA